MAVSLKPQPLYRNIHVFQLTHYRLPPAGIVSILHRISGAVMFFLLPFTIWLFDNSITSEVSYGVFSSAFTAGVHGVPGWFFKLLALGLIWSYLHHFIAGLRHLWMDMTHAVSREFGHSSAWVVLVSSIVLTLVLGAKLFF